MMRKVISLSVLLFSLPAIAGFLYMWQVQESRLRGGHSLNTDNRYAARHAQGSHDQGRPRHGAATAGEEGPGEISFESVCLKELELLISYSPSPEERSQLMTSCIERKRREANR